MSFFRMMRHDIIKRAYPGIESDTITAIEHDWMETFVLLPHRTISGRWVWLRKIYCRRVWRYTGFVDEPFTEYGDVFDILADEDSYT